MELILLALHATFICGTLLPVLYGDLLGLEWLTGARTTLGERLVGRLRWLAGAGLCGILATGFLLALPKLVELRGEPLFVVKLIFVGALVINALMLGELAAYATEMPFKEVPRAMRKWFYVSAFVSVFGWLGAICCGLFLVD